jgi:hypothetical protein
VYIHEGDIRSADGTGAAGWTDELNARCADAGMAADDKVKVICGGMQGRHVRL